MKSAGHKTRGFSVDFTCVPLNSGGDIFSFSSSSFRSLAEGEMTKLSSVSSASEKDGRSHVGQMLHTPLIDSIIALPSCSESVRVCRTVLREKC